MSIESIKALRDKTGAGMVDCKKALEEASGDMDAAIEILRKRGIAKAAKRGDRQAEEGVIKLAVNETASEGYMVEVNAETDFVVRNDKFQQFVGNLLELAMKSKTASRDALESLAMDGATVREALDNLSGVIGEKLAIKDVAMLGPSGTVSGYSHMDGRIGVLVALDKPDMGDLARDIAMQVAAANPRFVSREEIPAEEIEKEKEIYREQLKKENKPDNIIDKIIGGKLGKFYSDICLVDQEYIKDDKKKVKDILGDVKVEKFIRFSLS